MSLARIVLAGPLALAALGPAAEAQTYPFMPLPERLEAAELVVRARVVAERESEVPGGRMAFTWVTFAPSDVLVDRTGFVTGPTFELPFAGGQVGQRLVRVQGVPSFEPGEEVLFFAQVTGPRLANPLIGGRQSLWRIADDRVTERRYPLTDGGRGLTLDPEGTLRPTAPLVDVSAGRPTYRPRTTLVGTIPTPQPVTGSGAVAVVRRQTGAPRPDAVVDLTVFRDVLMGLEAERLAALAGADPKGGAK